MDQIQLIAPNGCKIVGMEESVLATAWVDGFTRGKNGEFVPEYAGESEIHWDTQESALDDPFVLDEDGERHLLSECKEAPAEREDGS